MDNHVYVKFETYVLIVPSSSKPVAARTLISQTPKNLDQLPKSQKPVVWKALSSSKVQIRATYKAAFTEIRTAEQHFSRALPRSNPNMQ